MLFYFNNAGNCFDCPALIAQTFKSDVISGRPYMVQSYTDIKGSPFLYDEWINSNVTTSKAFTYLGVMIRFDIHMNKFFYTQSGSTYEFADDVKEVELFPVMGDSATKRVFKKGFAINNKVTPGTYAEVMVEGRVIVLKHIYINVSETTEYGVPGKVKNFTVNTAWYYSKGQDWISQKPGAKVLEELAGDKWKEIQQFIKTNTLNLKKENDFIKYVAYLNSL